MRQTYENNKRRIQAFKLTADLKDDNGVIHHFVDGYEYVKIGGVKWATCNVGAEKETDSGLYFAWGETKGYTADQVGSGCGQKCFTWNDYELKGENMLKYNMLDGLTILEAYDDAATQNMGENWRMPTKDEFNSLLSATTNKWTTVNGVKGRLLTDKTDDFKKLFFPAVGNCYDGSVYNVGSKGYYWSSLLDTLNVVNCWYLNLNSWNCYMNYGNRLYGFPVRAVFGQK